MTTEIAAIVGNGGVRHWVNTTAQVTRCGIDTTDKKITEAPFPRDDFRYRSTCNRCDKIR
jgi:hypothetical protein